MFGDIKTEHNAKQQLKWICQKGSAQSHTSKFLQLALHTTWGNNILMSLWEDSLKDEIQEKLLWVEQPKTLNRYIELAVKIDNKLYNYNARKKGFNHHKEPRTNNYWANDKWSFQQHNQQRYEDFYGLQLMKLDAMQQQPCWGDQISAQEKEWWWNERLCFTCGKSGHMLKDCQQKKNRSPQ